MVLARVGGGDQMLAPVLDPAHRPVEMHRQPRRPRPPPAAADPFQPKPPPTSGATTRIASSDRPRHSDSPLRTMCGIWVAECSTSCSACRSHCATTPLPFQRHHALPRGADGARHLAPAPPPRPHRTRRRHWSPGRCCRSSAHARAARRVRAAASMSTFAASSSKSALTWRGDVLRLGAAVGDADRDRLADEAHLVVGQRRLLGDLEPRQAGGGADRAHAGARQVGPGEHRAAHRLGNVEAADARVGDADCARRPVRACRPGRCRRRTGRGRAAGGRPPCGALWLRRRRPAPSCPLRGAAARARTADQRRGECVANAAADQAFLPKYPFSDLGWTCRSY